MLQRFFQYREAAQMHKPTCLINNHVFSPEIFQQRQLYILAWPGPRSTHDNFKPINQSEVSFSKHPPIRGQDPSPRCPLIELYPCVTVGQ